MQTSPAGNLHLIPQGSHERKRKKLVSKYNRFKKNVSSLEGKSKYLSKQYLSIQDSKDINIYLRIQIYIVSKNQQFWNIRSQVF